MPLTTYPIVLKRACKIITPYVIILRERGSVMYSDYTVLDDGTILGKRGQPLTTKMHKGYLHVTIKTHKVPVHRVVATVKVPNPENKPDIHHIDNNPMNNHPTNLQWVTRAEHRAIHHKDLNVNSKLDWDKVDYIRANLTTSTNDLAYELGVSPTAISLVKHNKTWKNARHP